MALCYAALRSQDRDVVRQTLRCTVKLRHVDSTRPGLRQTNGPNPTERNFQTHDRSTRTARRLSGRVRGNLGEHRGDPSETEDSLPQGPSESPGGANFRKILSWTKRTAPASPFEWFVPTMGRAVPEMRAAQHSAGPWRALPFPPEFAPCAPLSLSCPVLGLQPSGLSWTLGSVFLTQGATRLCWAPRPGPRPGNSLEPGRVAVIDPVLTGPLPSTVWCPASRKSPFRIFYLLSVVSGRRGKPGPIWAIRAAHLMGRSQGAFRNGLG